MTEGLTFSLHFLFSSSLSGILKRRGNLDLQIPGPCMPRGTTVSRGSRRGGHLWAKERPQEKPHLLTLQSPTLDQGQEINVYCLSLLFQLFTLICGYLLWQPHSKNTEAWKILSELCFGSDALGAPCRHSPQHMLVSLLSSVDRDQSQWEKTSVWKMSIDFIMGWIVSPSKDMLKSYPQYLIRWHFWKGGSL